jgi:hypothetical protein
MSKGIRRGNKSIYTKQNKNDTVEEVWRAELNRPTLSATYDRLRSPEFADISVKGRSVWRALEFLAVATEDEVFRSAALALQAYGLNKGGLKASVLRIFRDSERTGEFAAMRVMHQFMGEGISASRAARATAVALGLPGQSLRSVADDLRKLYPKWLKLVDNNIPRPAPPDGSTGRKLRIQLRPVIKRNDGVSRLSRFPSDMTFDAEGWAIVPDNREWRRLVHKGFAVHFGVIESEVGKTLPEKSQDDR